MQSYEIREINEELKGTRHQIHYRGAGVQVYNEEGDELFFSESVTAALLEIGRRLENPSRESVFALDRN